MTFEQNPAMLTPETPRLHQYDRQMQAFSVPILVLVTVSVILRFVARFKTKVSLGSDDWFCLLSYAFFLAYWIIVEVNTTTWGVYMVPDYTLTVPSLIKTLKSAYITLPIWVVSIFCAKMSILSLYLRLFPTRRFKMAIWFVIFLTLAWFITTFLFVLFRCTPPKAAYNILLPQNCANFVTFFEVSEPFYMLSTLLIVLIPVSVIKTLKMPMRRKIQLIAVFGLGIFITLISIIRLSLTHGDVQKMIGHTAFIWSNIQILCSVVIINLPTYGPLMTSLETGTSRLSSYLMSFRTRKGYSDQSSEPSTRNDIYQQDHVEMSQANGKPDVHSQARMLASSRNGTSENVV